MQIVIDIPEELKNKIDNANEDNYKTYIWWFETTLYCAIKNGTPLPKGHGAIKDVSQIEIPMCEDRAYETWVQVAINAAPTIIEADKAGEEE